MKNGWKEIIQMKSEPGIFISDIDDIKAFVQMHLDKEKEFQKVWKKATKK